MLKASISSNSLIPSLDCKPSIAKPPNRFGLYTSPLSSETLAVAARELRETPEQVQKSLTELRELLKSKLF